jgi:hypothetical protein
VVSAAECGRAGAGPADAQLERLWNVARAVLLAAFSRGLGCLPWALRGGLAVCGWPSERPSWSAHRRLLRGNSGLGKR